MSHRIYNPDLGPRAEQLALLVFDKSSSLNGLTTAEIAAKIGISTDKFAQFLQARRAIPSEVFAAVEGLLNPAPIPEKKVAHKGHKKGHGRPQKSEDK